MKIKKCDKCGVIESAENKIENLFTAYYRKHSSIASWGEREKFDLCDNCADEIYKQITGREISRRVVNVPG